jgi:hypothetical protein
MKKCLLLFIIISFSSYAQLNTSLPPGSNFDLSAWKLQTLDSNYNFVEKTASQLSAGYTTSFFYTNPNDGSMVFKVPSNGGTTSGSSYPRVELRQMTQGANWALTDTNQHYLTAQCKVISVASAKPQTIIGQIHGSETNSELLKLRWTGGAAGQCFLEARYQRNDSARTEYGVTLASGLSLGSIISYTITMKNGTITCTVNGNSASQTYTPYYYGTADQYYFKAGDYLQYHSTDSSIYGLTQFYKVSLYQFYTLNLTALIQGLYNGSSMVPDTVTVELHNTSSPYSLVEAKNGVLSSAGAGTFKFTSASNSIPFYLVVKHRNGLETWSASPQTFSSGALTYNFTAAANRAFGSNMILKSTKWCIYSGDVNHDGSVDLTDLIAVDNDNANFVTGYVNTDVNGDGSVDLSDLIIVDNNNAAFISKVVPPPRYI